MIRVILGLSLALFFGISVSFQPAAAQDDTYTVSISALNCPTEEDAVDWSPANPDSECDQGLGVIFRVASTDTGAEFDACVSDWQPPSMAIGCSITVPTGVQVLVTEDTTTIPAGYVPVDNPLYVSQPAEDGPAQVRFINVLQADPPAEPPAVQPGDPYNLPIQVTNCTLTPPEPSAVPAEGCESAPGISFTVTDANTGDVYGNCESAAVENYDYAQCEVTVPVGSTVVVTEDTSTVPAGYIPRENPVTREIFEGAIQAGEGAYAPFQNILQTAPPAGAEPTPAPPSDAGAPPQLPNTGTGPSVKQRVSLFR